MADAAYIEDIALAERASHAYYDSDEPILSDEAFDALLDRIAAYEKQHPDAVIGHHLFDRVGGGAAAAGDVEHLKPMLSLDKVRDLEAVTRFAESVFAAGSAVELEPKLDGLAIAAEYRGGRLVRVSRRGDGLTGEDVTSRTQKVHAAYLPETIPLLETIEVRGELLMSIEDFEYSNKARVDAGREGYANPRNAMAGALGAGVLVHDVRSTFVLYDRDDLDVDPTSIGFLPAATLLPPQAVTHQSATSLIEAITTFGQRRAAGSFPYPTDGVVIKAVDKQLRERLGHTSRAPRWAMAYKYEATSATTTLRDIVMGVGRTGNISFTGVFDPVTVDGSTIGRATLHNFDFIAERDIRIGDTVEVYKANDVIPRIERSFPDLRNGTERVYEPERVSPVSGAPLDTSQVIWRSTDPADSLGSWISYAVSRDCFDIEGVGGEIAAALVDANMVDDIGDLFSLRVDELAALTLSRGRVLGEKNAAKIVEQIDAARQAPLARAITALGIRRSGRTFGRRLAAHFHTMGALRAATVEQLQVVDGVGPERAALFFEGLQGLGGVLDKLADAGVNMGAEEAGASGAPRTLDGLTVVVTGAMTGVLAGRSRNEMNEMIEAHGGKASGSVSKKTGLLVCGEPGSSKWQKATDLGVRIVTPEEFAELLSVWVSNNITVS